MKESEKTYVIQTTPGEEDKVGIFLVSIKEEEEEEEDCKKRKDGLMSHKIGSIKI